MGKFYTPKELGTLVRNYRKHSGLTQKDLALEANVGVRFISEFERGKPSCELGKVLQILKFLEIRISLETDIDELNDLDNLD